MNITKSDIYGIPLRPKKSVLKKQDIYDLFDRITKPHTKVLMALLYMTSLRISEALKLTRLNFQKQDDVIVVNAINLKSVHVTDKVIPLVAVNDKEQEMIDLIESYYSKKYERERLFKCSRTIAHQYFEKYKVNLTLTGFTRYCKKCGELMIRVKKGFVCINHGQLKRKDIKFERYTTTDYVSVNPHYFRHCRLSHLSDMGLDITDLMNIAGWVTPNMAAIYVRRNIERTINKLKKFKQETP